MSHYRSGVRTISWESHLLGLSGFPAVACLVFIWQNSDPVSVSIPEVIVPLGISIGLSLYTIRLRRQSSLSSQSRPMVKYGWIGAVASGAIGGLWLVLHLYYGLPIDVLPDKILTVSSLGIAAGVLVGRSSRVARRNTRSRDRNHVLAETTWTNRPESDPIVSAIVEALAEVEGTDPLELDPLYTYVDLDVLAKLRSHDGSEWQFAFYTDEYEIRVSGQGVVTVYRLVLKTR